MLFPVHKNIKSRIRAHHKMRLYPQLRKYKILQSVLNSSPGQKDHDVCWKPIQYFLIVTHLFAVDYIPKVQI